MADLGDKYRKTGDSVKSYLRICAPELHDALERLAKVAEQASIGGAQATALTCSGGPSARCGPPAARIDRPDGPVACVYHAAGHPVYPLNPREAL